MATYDPRRKKDREEGPSWKKKKKSESEKTLTIKQQQRAKIRANAQRLKEQKAKETAAKKASKPKKKYVSPYERKHGKKQPGVASSSKPKRRGWAESRGLRGRLRIN